MRIIIVGGGLGGLAAALGFLNHPDLSEESSSPRHEIRVVDVKTRPTDAGASIFIRPQAHTYLRKIAPQHLGPLFDRSEKQLNFTIVDKGVRSRLDFGTHFVYTCVYQEVYDALYEACESAGISMEFGKAVKDVSENPDEAIVTFADGSTTSADLIVGSDGARSTIRQSLFDIINHPNPGTTFDITNTGIYDILAVIPVSEVGSAFTALDGVNGALIAKGEIGLALAYFLDAEHKWIGLVLQSKIPVDEVKKWEARTIEDKVDALQTFQIRLKDIIGPFESLVKWAISNPDRKISLHRTRFLELPPTWHSQRIVLIGDAAHAIPPFTAYGFTSTVLDSSSLALYLASMPSSPQFNELGNTLAAWEKERRPEMLKVREETLLEGKNRYR